MPFWGKGYILWIYKFNSKDKQSWNIWGRKYYWTVQWTVLGWAHHMYGVASKLLRAELPLAYDLFTLCFCASVFHFHLIKCISWYLEVLYWGWILMLHSFLYYDLKRLHYNVKVTLVSVKPSSSSIIVSEIPLGLKGSMAIIGDWGMESSKLGLRGGQKISLISHDMT